MITMIEALHIKIPCKQNRNVERNRQGTFVRSPFKSKPKCFNYPTRIVMPILNVSYKNLRCMVHQRKIHN